ncbi:MAG: DUF4080 domain-containing protein [Kiritimatiellaeota bacterium]|nr:DUF4080 domain-containing protein [Kiritimatiellota bacterium]
MTAIILATFNARYQHPALGLRYLQANLGAARADANLLEFDLQTPPLDAAEQILARQPRIVGLGVYIWNVRLIAELLAILRRVRPELLLVVGGPEMGSAAETQPLAAAADYVLCGEADLALGDLCRKLLADSRPSERIIRVPPPDLAQLELPYELYTDKDLQHRLVYVEASRGCPFGCEYCLSSSNPGVRRFPLKTILPAFDRLLARGARRFKFVDRTFNLDLDFGRAILEFWYARQRPGLEVHFELVPDRLTDDWLALLGRAPPGLLRLEVGVQTFDAAVAARVGRRQDPDRVTAALRALRTQTPARLHADLIAGLPGETLAGLAAGFDRLVRLQPHEIQVGLLKHLRGTALGRHDEEWGMVYTPQPPYELLHNRLLDFVTLQGVRRFARFWESLYNSGHFLETLPRLWAEAGASPFAEFSRLSDWLWARWGRCHALPLVTLTEGLFLYLTEVRGLDKKELASVLLRDYTRDARREIPGFLRPDR